MTTLVSFFQALSPLHAGVGQGIGTIDLPIAREKSTNIPFVPGSSVKGVLRERCKEPDVQRALFGPDTQGAAEICRLGVFFGPDSTVLAHSQSATAFSWVTSPYILRRFQRDLIANAAIKALKVPAPGGEANALVASKDLLLDNKAYLEELDLDATENSDAKAWANELGKLIFPNDEAWRKVFLEQFCICHDDVFSYFMEHGTQVTARIRLEEETKTVAPGGLWYEESLPVETLLWGLVQVDAPKGGKLDVDSVKEMQNLVSKPVQLGGKATVGRGFGWLKLSGGKA